MIKIYTEDFELDLSHLKVTLIEENNVFQKSDVRNYSLPFSFYLDDEAFKKLGFIDDYQSRKRIIKHFGKLEFGNKFEECVLYLKKTKKGAIQGQITYGKSTTPVLDIPLKDLPFQNVTVANMSTHAKATLDKTWPETSYNFPMIIDLKFYENSNYEKFQGIINQTDVNGNVVANSMEVVNSENVLFNRNVLTPCVHLMHVLKTGFDYANITMAGEFVNDKVNEKLLLFVKKHLESLDANKVNTFATSFYLGDFLPDMTFGEYLNKIRNWLNLDITYRKNIVTINYLENKFKAVAFKDFRHLENDDVETTFNEKEVYSLTADTNNTIYLDSKGNEVTLLDYTKSNVEPIDMGVTVLRQNTHNSITTAETIDGDSDFMLILYNGLQSNQNIAPASVYGRSFSLTEVKDRFWKMWISFRLNALSFLDSYEVDEDDTDIKEGMFKYQNKHLIKKITRRLDGSKVNVTIESESLV